MMKYNFYEKYILFLFYINKNFQILTKQNVRITIKFSFFLSKYSLSKKLNLFIMYLFLY